MKKIFNNNNNKRKKIVNPMTIIYSLAFVLLYMNSQRTIVAEQNQTTSLNQTIFSTTSRESINHHQQHQQHIQTIIRDREEDTKFNNHNLHHQRTFININKIRPGCYDNSTIHVTKTVLSSNNNQPIMWLLAGLEHTGHHLWKSIRSYLNGTTRTAVHEIGAPLFRWGLTDLLLEEGRGWECWTEFVPPHDKRFHESNRNMSMQQIDINLFQKHKKRYMQLEGVIGASEYGWCSYPCHKWSKLYEGLNPDLVSLAIAAEKADVDLRILVLTRPVIKIMHEFNTDRAKVYAASCWELVLQLQAVDTKFFTCFPYDEYNSLISNWTALQTVSRFLYGPTRDDDPVGPGPGPGGEAKEIIETLRDAISQAYRPGDRNYPFSAWEGVEQNARIELETCGRILEEVANCDRPWNL